MSTRVHVYTTSQLCARLHKISLDQSHAKWIFAVSMLTVGLNTYLASRCNLCVLRRLLIHRKKKSTSYIKRIVILFFLQKSINSIIYEDIQDWKELHVSINITSKINSYLEKICFENRIFEIDIISRIIRRSTNFLSLWKSR